MFLIYTVRTEVFLTRPKYMAWLIIRLDLGGSLPGKLGI